MGIDSIAETAARVTDVGTAPTSEDAFCNGTGSRNHAAHDGPGDDAPRLKSLPREAVSPRPTSRAAAAAHGSNPARPSCSEERSPRDDGLRAEVATRHPETLRPEPARIESLPRAGVLPACRHVRGILIAALLSCTAGLAGAQTTVTYVSNTAQEDSQFSFSSTEFAQNFTTGSQEGGYPLTSVQLRFLGMRGGDPISVSVCSVDSNDLPTSTCTALTPPVDFPPGTVVTLDYTAPENTVLTADTTYALHITQGERRTLSVTGSNREDSGGAEGWSIDDGHRRLLSGSSQTDTRSFRIAIRATFQPPTAADNTVTTLEDTPYAFGAGDFNFSGADMNDTLEGVTVVSLPAEGALTLGGSPVTANQTVTRAAIDAGRLSFAPAENANGNGYASFTFRVRDTFVASDDAYTMTRTVGAISLS